mmetsp:Transcript_82957/g.231424  ORF Transcript_82957/g.231424 Transcript_82957/m.231424 type:complete len:203 (-) Transcript_82957:457-1065(-)
MDVWDHDVLDNRALRRQVLTELLLILGAIQEAIVYRRQEVLHDDIRASVVHLVLADAAPETFDEIELDDALDEPVHVAVQHGGEFGDLLVLEVFAAFLVRLQENRVGRRQLHEASAGGVLHQEGSLLAPQDEGNQANSAWDIVVCELHKVAAGNGGGTEAREKHLQHPQAEVARRTGLHPLVRLHARQQDVIDLVHVFEQLE